MSKNEEKDKKINDEEISSAEKKSKTTKKNKKNESIEDTLESQEASQAEELKTEEDEAKAKEEEKQKALATEEVISYEEINLYLYLLNKNKTLNGFRKGKIPFVILYTKHFDAILNFCFSMKVDRLKEYNLYPTIIKTESLEEGLKIFYKIEEKKDN